MTGEKTSEKDENKMSDKMAEKKPMNLGDIIKQTGDFGLFQVLLYAFTVFSLGVLNWSMMTMAFTASVPNWECFRFSMEGNMTRMWSESNVCEVNGTTCDRIVFADDMKTAVSEWSLICDNKWISQTITTIQMAGLLAGALFWGHVSDGIGRKPTFYLNILLLGSFNLVSYFSVSWIMFAAMRCGIGFSCAGFMVSVVSFEYIRNKWRVYLYLVPGWAMWASLMALFCWLIPDWHYIHIAITAMSVMILLTWRFVPESFRWLACNGRTEEAEREIKYVAKINRKPAPSIKLLQSVVEAEQQEAEQTKALQVYTVLDLFRTSRIRKTTILFSLVWLFSSFSYYGIAFAVQELSGNFYLNLFLLSVADIPGYYLLVLFNTWGGRRWTCVGFYFIGGMFALAVGVMKYTDANVAVVVINVSALVAKLWVSAAWDLNTLWSTESFPTVVRYIGAGFISSVSRVGSMVAPQIITLGMDVPGLLYIVSGIVCVLSCVLCIFLEETKDRDLADLIPAKTDKLNNVETGQIHDQLNEDGEKPKLNG